MQQLLEDHVPIGGWSCNGW